jgi:aminoglycoside 6'-N-acetyltransferase
MCIRDFAFLYPMKQPEIRLRPAHIGDLALMRHWDNQPHVWDSDPDDDWDWENQLQLDPVWRQQLMAELDGRPFGFVQIIDPLEEETHYWGDVPPNLRAIDIWIGEADLLGKGYGKVMMEQALALCFAAPEVEAVLIDPLATNLRAQRFYLSLGFMFIERRVFYDSDCAVMRLERAGWEKYLASKK